MLVETLIDKAGKALGSRYKLAAYLDVPISKIYDWQSRRAVCSPADQARIAAIAGADPVLQLMHATISRYAGTIRGDQLAIALNDMAYGTTSKQLLDNAHRMTPRQIKLATFHHERNDSAEHTQTMY